MSVFVSVRHFRRLKHIDVTIRVTEFSRSECCFKFRRVLASHCWCEKNSVVQYLVNIRYAACVKMVTLSKVGVDWVFDINDNVWSHSNMNVNIWQLRVFWLSTPEDIRTSSKNFRFVLIIIIIITTINQYFVLSVFCVYGFVLVIIRWWSWELTLEFESNVIICKSHPIQWGYVSLTQF
jgi:hypothetical protein